MNEREHRLLQGLVGCLLLTLASCGGDDPTFPEHAAYKAQTPTPLPCVPNLDGQIDAAELAAYFGVTASYLVSTKDRTVNLPGKDAGNGASSWDFTGDYADDRVATIEAVKVDAQWFASSFPGGQFVTPFDAGNTLSAVYAQTTDAVLLLGIASTQEKPSNGQTLFVYDTPVVAFQLPLLPGNKWVSVGEVKNAVLDGLPYAGKDTYEFSVDGIGKLSLPEIELSQVLRVRAKVTIEPVAGTAVSTRQTSFLAECFGEVTRASSHQNEPDEDFTVAAEVRRLGF